MRGYHQRRVRRPRHHHPRHHHCRLHEPSRGRRRDWLRLLQRRVLQGWLNGELEAEAQRPARERRHGAAARVDAHVEGPATRTHGRLRVQPRWMVVLVPDNVEVVVALELHH